MKCRYKPHLLRIERKRTSIGRDLENGLRLDRNERVIDFPKELIEDIYKSIPKYTFNAYPSPDSLYRKLAGFLNMSKERIYITNAITEGIRIVFETLISPGDKIVGVSPTFPMYRIYSDIYQANLQSIGFLDDLALDFEGLCEAVNSDVCFVYLPNPNLPIESVVDLEKIRRLADRCKECGAALIVDEAYCFFGSESAIDLIDEYDNLIVFQTFSKAFGLAGIRLGYIVSSQENIEYLSKTRSLVESNGISMAVGEYMLDHPEIMEEYIQQVKEGADYTKRELTKLGFRFFGGNVTNGMLIFLENSEQTNDLMQALKEKKIYIRGSFGDPIDNCVRVTIGPKQVMEKFIEGFCEWARS